jgi:PAS domain S-box-containing protein
MCGAPVLTGAFLVKPNNPNALLLTAYYTQNMKITLSPLLLGDLIEKGYTYMLSSSNADTSSSAGTPVTLRPVKEKPALTDLPEGFETIYQITREPMQMACGVDETEITVEYDPDEEGITERQLLEDRYFRMSEDFFRLVLDSLEDYAVITTDTNGDINSWNSGAEKLLGYKEHEILGLNARVFFTPEDIERGAPEKELADAIKLGKAIDERYHVRKDKSQFWGSGLVFPLHDEDGQHRGFTKIMRNLKEQVAAEYQNLF